MMVCTGPPGKDIYWKESRGQVSLPSLARSDNLDEVCKESEHCVPCELVCSYPLVLLPRPSCPLLSKFLQRNDLLVYVINEMS